MARILDILFFVYFLTHIPIALLVDFQALIPSQFFPQQLVALREWYCREYRDPMMMAPPIWYQSLIFCELFQFFFFFVASYGFFKGAKQCKWLRWPCVVYGSHVVTTLIPIIAHVLFYDFSKEKFAGPRNMKERLTLLSFYSPYFFIPILLLLDTLFSSVYQTTPQQQHKTQQQQKTQQAQKKKVK
ncbi:sigma intracellular receptor 2-like [Physella acuta]|uniref:sigma intracellular receptor 2-like n=1 Tax=Physella acuta TaxID=109671 RepID=UPI0027DE0549|nr:sigma intracellular receptor 2-like [Physella acuta]